MSTVMNESMNGKIRILVAEDHLVARVGVSTIVNMQPDMTVVAEASNGQQAVEMFRQYVPDVTLLDLRMPVMGGVEAAAAIKSIHPHARMIALTTYGGDEDIKRARVSELALSAGTLETRGEFVLVIGPPAADAQTMSENDLDELLRTQLLRNSVKDAVAHAVELSGRPRREIYARALDLARESNKEARAQTDSEGDDGKD